MQLPKILLVEDDRSITNALAEVLSNSYDVLAVATGQMAFYKVDSAHSMEAAGASRHLWLE